MSDGVSLGDVMVAVVYLIPVAGQVVFWLVMTVVAMFVIGGLVVSI